MASSSSKAPNREAEILIKMVMNLDCPSEYKKHLVELERFWIEKDAQVIQDRGLVSEDAAKQIWQNLYDLHPECTKRWQSTSPTAPYLGHPRLPP